MKAQAALEFITTYGWALMTILLVAIAAYYFIQAKPVTTQCDFGPTIYCSSYQFFKKTDGTMRLRFTMANSLGKVISLWAPNPSGSGYLLISQTLTVSNIGKSGVNNYSGTCTGPALYVKNGDLISCNFDIPDKNLVPDIGRMVKLDTTIKYTMCETDPLYPARCNGDNRTMYGSIMTPLEAGINYSALPNGAYCMDGTCTWPENYTTCPWDCQPPYPASISVVGTDDCLWDYLEKDVEFDQINATVKDQYGNPLPGAYVKIYPEDIPGFPEVVQHITSYTVDPPIAVTDSNGVATALFSWHACDCCFPYYMCGFGAIYQYAAVSGQAYGVDGACGVIDGSEFPRYGLHCCWWD